MRTIRNTFAASLAVAILALALPSQAAQQSFGITNYLVAGANGTFTGYPTNQSTMTNYGTAGAYSAATGVPIDVSRYNELGFGFSGLLNNTNGTAYYLTFYLARSMSGNTPYVSPIIQTNTVITSTSTNTNNFSWQCDFETPVASGIPIPGSFIQFVIPASQTNVPINFQTNLPVTYIGNGTTWIGIYCISNNMANTAWITNAAAYIGKKIIPISLSSN